MTEIVKKYESLSELQGCKFVAFSETNQKPSIVALQKCGLIHLLNVVCSSCSKQIMKYGKAISTLPPPSSSSSSSEACQSKQDDKDDKKNNDNAEKSATSNDGQYFCPAQEGKAPLEEEEEDVGVNLCLECKNNVERGLPFGNGNVQAYALYCAEKVRTAMKGENESAMNDGVTLLIHASSCKRSDGLWSNASGFLSLIARDLRASKIKVEERQNELAVVKASCLCGESACSHEFVVKLFTPYSEPMYSGYSRSNPPILVRVSATEKQLAEEQTDQDLIEQHNKDCAAAKEKQEALEKEVLGALQFRAAMRRAYFNIGESEVQSRAMSLFYICRDSFANESRLRPAFASYVDLADKKKKRRNNSEHIIISDMDDIFLVKADTKTFEVEGYGEVYKLMCQCTEPDVDEEKAYRGIPADYLEQFKTIRNWEFVKEMVNRDGYAAFLYRRLQDGDMRKKNNKKK